MALAARIEPPPVLAVLAAPRLQASSELPRGSAPALRRSRPHRPPSTRMLCPDCHPLACACIWAQLASLPCPVCPCAPAPPLTVAAARSVSCPCLVTKMASAAVPAAAARRDSASSRHAVRILRAGNADNRNALPSAYLPKKKREKKTERTSVRQLAERSRSI
jgi:hypothetical protein